MNASAGFRAVFRAAGGGTGAVLRVTARSFYRAWVNGEFLGRGPARGPHGFERVDEWDVGELLRPGRNIVAVEVNAYHANSYCRANGPGFLQAELVAGGKVLASTGGEGRRFAGRMLDCRIRRAQRFSSQRGFVEVYALRPGFDSWIRDPDAKFRGERCATLPRQRLLPRGVPPPCMDLRQPVRQIAAGRMEPCDPRSRPDYRKDPLLERVGPTFKGYREGEIEVLLSDRVQSLRRVSRDPLDEPWSPNRPVQLRAGEYRILDFGVNLTGSIAARIRARRGSELHFTFDEILSPGGDVDFRRNGSTAAVGVEVEPGTYEIETFEPYTLRYLKIAAAKGDCEVSGVRLREHAAADACRAHFACSDRRLNRIFEAARETFRQNAVDIFMDCPSRERAGWLCDSYFTARAERVLTGGSRIERNFLEDFLLPDRFPDLPDGMIPMCYPSDHPTGNFIPNWAMFFVLQLEEYAVRSGDRALAGAFRDRILALFRYFNRFLNSDGLLEKLEKWVFVEWSEANKFTQDVNYPTNMLYAAALDAAGRMYGIPSFRRRAEAVRREIRRQSRREIFYADNAVRKDGRLEVTDNFSEVCQYFAFYFGVADPERDPELWRILRDEFGPRRRETKAHPEVHHANAFIGNVLRLEVLSRYGLCAKVADELAGYYLHMAERTGTLWENDGAHASCNHGFASHAACVILRDVLGLFAVDAPGRKVRLRLADVPIEWCEGRVPVGDEGYVSLSWERCGRELRYRLSVPAGYEVEIKNTGGLELKAE